MLYLYQIDLYQIDRHKTIKAAIASIWGSVLKEGDSGPQEMTRPIKEHNTVSLLYHHKVHFQNKEDSKHLPGVIPPPIPALC